MLWEVALQPWPAWKPAAFRQQRPIPDPIREEANDRGLLGAEAFTAVDRDLSSGPNQAQHRRAISVIMSCSLYTRRESEEAPEAALAVAARRDLAAPPLQGQAASPVLPLLPAVIDSPRDKRADL